MPVQINLSASDLEPALLQAKSYEDYLTTVLCSRSSFYEGTPIGPATRLASQRLYAYYLPQFHPTEMNDAAWGKGFTEWTNVARALPMLRGQVLPRRPADLGYYDLRLRETIRQQCYLARAHGISGFCFYYYWFGGRRLLDAPLDLFVNSKDISLGFCICWANENWTRRWDGEDQEVFVAQRHDPEIDQAFAHSLLPLVKDQRYLRQGGRPVIVIYKTHLIHRFIETAERWRTIFRKEGGGDVMILATTASHNLGELLKAGAIDGIAEFPPHGFWPRMALAQDAWIRLSARFRGLVGSYADLEQQYRSLQYGSSFVARAAIPGWDNTPRRLENALVYLGGNPHRFSAWLAWALENSTRQAGESITFLNAWNEWAESSYVEPDRWYGYAYLNAVSRALDRQAAE